MEGSIQLLLISAVSLGLVHTISGPDHYLPFVAMAKIKEWSISKTIFIVTLCGLGHVLSSVGIGFIGIAAGVTLNKLSFIEGMRGNVASWLLFIAGVVYTLWAIIQKIRKHDHKHSHLNADKLNKSMTFWVLFTIFIFGPCEPLIPILMFPAAEMNTGAVILISSAFAITTIITMISATLLLLKGINLINLHKIEKYKHILAGTTLMLSGAGIIFLGL